MANDPYAVLAQYLNRPLGNQSSIAPAVSDVAKFIVLNSEQSTAATSTANKNEPSWMSKIFDILSRPNYAIANLTKDAKEAAFGQRNDFNPLSSILSGLAGTQKTTFQDVMKQSGVEGPAGAVLGLAGDIALDPTSYVGPGLIGKGLKAVGLGKKAVEADRTLPLAQQLLNKGEPVNPELFGLPSVDKTVPPALKAGAPVDLPLVARDALNLGKQSSPPPGMLDLPGVKSITGSERKIQIPEDILAKLGEPAAAVSKEVKGQQAFKFPGFDVKKIRAAVEASTAEKASKIVAGVEKGNIEDALKMAPPIKIAPDAVHSIAAEDILKKFNPSAAAAEINKLAPNTLNAKQQAKLWYKARELGNMMTYKKGRSAAKIEKDVLAHTTKIYNALEAKLVEAGKVPRIGTGENVSLSDVLGDLQARGVPINDAHIKEFGTALKPGSEISGAVERMKARGVINDSVPVHKILDAINEAKAGTTSIGGLSDASTKNWDGFLKDFAKYSSRTMGVSPAGEKAAGKLVNMALDAGKSSAQIATQKMAKQLEQVVASGKVNPKVNHGLTLALEKDMGKIPKWAVNDNKAVEWIMSRVATWWGQAELRPLTLNQIASGAATAEARGKVLAKMFQGFNDVQRGEAFRLAQGVAGNPSSPEVQQLAMQIGNVMSDLASKSAGASVLIRSGINIDMLNKWMRRYGTKFEFTRRHDVKNPITGESMDFSKGADWLDSWKTAELGEDPANWMFKTMQAVEQATREKAVFDELGERFGSSFFGREYRTQVTAHPYLDGYYFPADIAKQIPRMVRDWTIGTGTNNAALKLYDKVLSMWKTLATIYRPAHHIRNLVGDVYMGMLDGVNGIKPYRLALKTLRLQKDSYTTMTDIDRLVEIGAVSKYDKTPMPGETLFSNKTGAQFTAEQIYAVAHQKGLFENVQTLEDIIDLGSGKAGFALSRPLGGKAQAVARGASELENNVTRLAHFIDVVQKSRGSDLPKIFEDAAARSRKFHPTGLDLTDFEKKYLRRIIPFYSWMRKSTPVLLEGMVMRPGVTLLPSKVNEAMQMAAGIDTTRDNPFPVDQMFPQWLRDEGIGPVGLPDGILGNFANEKPPGYVQAGVGLNPISQLIAEIQHPGKTIGSGLTPAIQIPLETLITGRKTFTGEPISGPDAKPGAMQQYIGEQIPVWSAIQGMIGTTPFGTDTKRGAQSDNQSGKEALVNWISGLGIKGTGPYKKSAKYEKFAPLQADRAQTKQDFIAELKNKLGG